MSIWRQTTGTSFSNKLHQMSRRASKRKRTSYSHGDSEGESDESDSDPEVLPSGTLSRPFYKEQYVDGKKRSRRKEGVDAEFEDALYKKDEKIGERYVNNMSLYGKGAAVTETSLLEIEGSRDLKPDDDTAEIIARFREMSTDRVKKQAYTEKIYEKGAEDVLASLEQDDFVNGILLSLEAIYTWKMHVYQKMYSSNRSDVPRKTSKMLYDTAKQKLVSLDARMLREDIRTAVNDQSAGIKSIKGQNRRMVRNMLCAWIYALSGGPQTFIDNFYHVVLLGNPGVGKTMLARVIGFVLSKCGVLLVGDFHEATKADLAGQYVGETAPKTRKKLVDSLESVLLIDEAYQLVQDDSSRDDFGHEAMAELVNFQDKMRGLSVIVAAGYEREMKKFIRANPGTPRRFPFKITLPDYLPEDLFRILELTLCKQYNKQMFTRRLAEQIVVLLGRLEGRFDGQGGDMVVLASSISTLININRLDKDRMWIEPGNSEYSEERRVKQNMRLVRDGLTLFLNNKVDEDSADRDRHMDVACVQTKEGASCRLDLKLDRKRDRLSVADSIRLRAASARQKEEDAMSVDRKDGQ
jgi:SpoVK/Ycf46/Vps4 family AAA+-type ATPase